MKSNVEQVEKRVEPRNGEFKRIVNLFLRRKIALAGVVIIVILIITAVLAPVLSPYDPYKPDLKNRLLQPSREHLLGTDSLGRDTLSRIIYGTRTSLLIGITSITLAATSGMLLGLIAAYFGGILNTIIMRVVDALMSIPVLLKALIIAALLGGGIKNIIIALGISMLTTNARLMYAQALTIKENDYILASRVFGVSNLNIMLRHIFPNCLPPLIVLMTMEMGACILAEAGLSFLGIGVEPPMAAWGSMVNEGYKFLFTNPILSFAPGLSIMLVVFGFNMAGDGLRDALDPRLRGTL